SFRNSTRSTCRRISSSGRSVRCFVCGSRSSNSRSARRAKMIPKPLARHLDGLRGQFILMLSAPWALVGLSYILFRTPTRAASFAYLPSWMDENELGWVWVIAAVVMVACAFIGWRYSHLASVGFLTVIVSPFLWALVFVV